MKLHYIIESHLSTYEKYKSQITKAQQFLIQRYGNTLSTRWRLKVRRINDSYGEIVISFELLPIDRPITRDDNKYYYKNVNNAIEAITKNDDLVYRGISWEEWESIKRKGLIQSNSGYNFEQQRDLTFYGGDPNTAEYYSSGFAPLQHKPTRSKPGVIISIPKEYVQNNDENEMIPHGEFAHRGPLSSDVIADVWMLVPTRINSGIIDVIINHRGYDVGSWSLPSVRYSIRKIK